uniref:CCHC-type domain-containing protein n=1 Tax=Tanacetum cinerariifolium TaxID=118510 RepID=A0A6L2MYA6_TANCI|nr:hypothetical protein [Tanacetum cinerariifolium]
METKVSSTEINTKERVPTPSNDPLPSSEDRTIEDVVKDVEDVVATAKNVEDQSIKAKGVTMQEPSKFRTTLPSQSSLASHAKDKGKGLMVEPEMPLTRKGQIALDEKVTKRLEAEWNADMKDNIDWNKAIEHDNAKKQNLEEQKDTEELKKNLEIIPDNEDDVFVNVTPLSSKPLIIVYYKIYKEGKKQHFQIFRTNGNHQMYLAFSIMLKNFDREDLEVLWKIVKDRFKKSHPNEVLDVFLWHTLKVMFEHTVEDNVWKHQKGPQGLAKMYSSTNYTLQQMFNEVRLQVDYEVEMAYDLLRLVIQNANQNPNGNGNLVAARAKGNGTGHIGNQIRCYNCRGVGDFARNCTVRPRRRDAAYLKTAYLQTQLLIAQKEEAGIQLQAEEFDLMAAAADLDEIEEVNANCILMANLQQASTSGQYTELLEPILKPHQVPQNDNNVISEVSCVEQSGGKVEQHPANVEETRALYDSLYNNLAIEVKKVNMVNRKLSKTNVELTTELARYKNQERCFEISQEKYDKLERCYQQSVYQEQCLSKKIKALHLSFGKQIMTLNEEISDLNKQLSVEKSNVSSLLEEKKKLKSDFKTREDELLDKQIQLDKRIMELDNILVKTVLHQDQPSFNQNYMQQPMPNPEDITDPTTTQLLKEEAGIQFQAEEFDLMAATADLDEIKEEEAGIQFQAEEFDLMATTADLDEIKEVNANCILMANLQQASTSGTQTEKALVYDSDGSAKVYNYENCYDNEIFNMFTQEEQYTELLEPIPEPHQVPQNDNNVISEKSVYQEQCLSKNINALYLSSGKQIMTLNGEISDLNKQLSMEKSTVSSLLEEKKKLKFDFKIREDELLDKQIQLEKRIKELDNILVKMGQSIQTIHMLLPKPDSFYHTEQKMALGYQNPFYLKQAQQKQWSLYEGKVLLEKHDPPVVQDSEETLQLAQESRLKMKQLNKEIKPANYTNIDHLSGVFVSQMAKSREELYFSNNSKTATVSKPISIPNEEFSDDTTPSVA